MYIENYDYGDWVTFALMDKGSFPENSSFMHVFFPGKHSISNTVYLVKDISRINNIYNVKLIKVNFIKDLRSI